MEQPADQLLRGKEHAARAWGAPRVGEQLPSMQHQCAAGILPCWSGQSKVHLPHPTKQVRAAH